MRPILVLEFNELSPELLERFIASGDLPAFARLRDRSSTYITEAGEHGVALNPWVQWVTVHTGVRANDHGIVQLGESHRLRLPTIADVVSASGGSVWQCGSMNVQPIGPVTGAVLPDPWSIGRTPQPASLHSFFRFVSASVQEHTNDRTPLSKREAVDFVRFLLTHGLTARTAGATVGQLVGERARRRGRWARAELLDRFQWDVFRHYHRKIRPTFATFFSNSTAHFQHLHWDDMERAPAHSAVLDGYRKMDALVASASRLVGDDATVVLCTALSQTANTAADRAREGFYRPRDLHAFAEQFGLRGVRDAAPVMAEQSHLFFTDASAAAEAAHALRAIRSNGDEVFHVEVSGAALFIGCQLFTRRPLAPDLDGVLYWTDAAREGTHHPDGVLWIGDGGSDDRDVRVPLESVARMLLRVIGVDAPPSMAPAPLVREPAR
ncbi:MAG: hypothetical protein QOD92_3546 [Acidimicrobiaceae bacterium]|jgi:hypothetical protein